MEVIESGTRGIYNEYGYEIVTRQSFLEDKLLMLGSEQFTVMLLVVRKGAELMAALFIPLVSVGCTIAYRTASRAADETIL